MKKFNSIVKYIFLSGFCLLTACDSDDSFLDPSSLIANGDTFIKTKMVGDEQVSATAYYLVANQMLKTATVQLPGEEGTVIYLQPDPNVPDGNVFVYEPTVEEYNSEPKSVGTYLFKASSIYEEVMDTAVEDELEEGMLDLLIIENTGFENNTLMVEWSPVVGTDEYLMRLYTKDGELIYYSSVMQADTYEYSFGIGSEGWVNGFFPEDESEYVLEVIAVMYEADANADNKGNNIQCLSMAQEEIVWN
ncbi:MAG: hypothetical protein N4A74_04195 [Carboxylicivirga sp.]|jgi:hypothetical protein|nr:hypothetical protein [Carboxylicivirga sp.]